jgi:DNA-directed RNA polymerase subunit RPC12/RpoP
MPIKFNCFNCGAKLRVPEEHIGKKARCPKCDEKCLVPAVSARTSESVAAQDLESNEQFAAEPVLGQATPVSLPPAVTAPTPEPLPPPPDMAVPVSSVPTSVPFASVASPYSSNAVNKRTHKGGAISHIMQPLYESRNMMKVFGWTNLIIGIIYCLTIFGAVIGWLFIWMGWLVKGAAEALTIGVETGDESQLRLANERIALYFKIIGVLTIIGLVIMALYILLFLVVIMLGVIGALGAA